jgi:hypothetical protein
MAVRNFHVAAMFLLQAEVRDCCTSFHARLGGDSVQGEPGATGRERHPTGCGEASEARFVSAAAANLSANFYGWRLALYFGLLPLNHLDCETDEWDHV